MMPPISHQGIADSVADDDVVLSVEGVSKKFCRSLKRSLFYGVQDISSELFGLRRHAQSLREKEFWALQDVSLQLRRGEAVGLVGVNGSGKTTLLRIISGLIRPDRGQVTVRGRVAPLIALGAGFNPLLTGRENIYANLSILGLSAQEIAQKFDTVVEFAEIGEALDSPVQTYSSGMAARLGFSCAAHADANILLIDEVLAVGDARFKAKCERRLAKLLNEGTAFVLVSHFAQSILNICSNAFYLHQGRIVMGGEARTVVNQYEQDLFSVNMERQNAVLRLPARSRHASAGADITAICFKDVQGQVIEDPISGEPTAISVECRIHQTIPQLSLFVCVFSIAREGEIALHLSSAYDNQTATVSPGVYELLIQLPYLGLYPGSYTMKAYVKDGSISTLDTVESFFFAVKGNHRLNRGIYYQPREWQLVKQSIE